MDFRIEPAGLDAVDTIVEQRRDMFTDMGHSDRSAIARMCAAFRPWLAEKMRAGEYLAWFALAGDQTAAGLGLWLMDWPPHMIGGASRRGNIINVYTRPEYRKQGMARALVGTALDFCRSRQIAAVVLHASPAGRPLYAALGFHPTNEMRLML